MNATNPFWCYIAGPVLAIVGGAALTGQRRRSFSIIFGVVALIPVAGFWQLNRDPDPTHNPAIVVTLVFMVAPMLVIFGIERAWWRVSSVRSRMMAVVSVAVGIVAYVATTLVALLAAGWLRLLDA